MSVFAEKDDSSIVHKFLKPGKKLSRIKMCNLVEGNADVFVFVLGRPRDSSKLSPEESPCFLTACDSADRLFLVGFDAPTSTLPPENGTIFARKPNENMKNWLAMILSNQLRLYRRKVKINSVSPVLCTKLKTNFFVVSHHFSLTNPQN